MSAGCSWAPGCPRPKTRPRLPPLCAAPGCAAAPGWGRRVSGRPREATSCRKAGAKGNGDREQPKCPRGCCPRARGDVCDPSLGAGERPHAGLCAADVVVSVVIAVVMSGPHSTACGASGPLPVPWERPRKALCSCRQKKGLPLPLSRDPRTSSQFSSLSGLPSSTPSTEQLISGL